MTSGGDEGRKGWLSGLGFLPVCLGVLLYLPSLGGTYVYDDVLIVLDDGRVTDPSQWGQYLWGREGYHGGADNLYRPVASLSLAAQAVLTGTAEGWGGAAWFHLVNVLLYGVVCGQAGVVAGRVFCSEAGRTRSFRYGFGGLVTGLLFAAHPVHAEVAASVVGRADLICAAGFFGALLVVTHPTRPMSAGRVAAVVGLTLLSVGGKEQGLVLPALVGVWYLARRRAGLATHLDGFGKPLAAALLLSLSAYLAWRESILPFAWPRSLLDPATQPMILADATDRWLMPVAVLGRAGQLLAVPWELSIDYGAAVIAPPQSFADPFLWLGIGVLIALVAAVVHAWRLRWAGGLFLLGGLALTYLPGANFVTIVGTVFGERLLFLPSFFAVAYAVSLASRVGMPRRATAGIAVLVVTLFSLRTVTYVVRWNDRRAFYEYQTEVQPRSVRVWLLAFDEALEAGDARAATFAARRATEVAPDYWNSWIAAADAGILAGDFEAARAAAERAKEIKVFLPTVAAAQRVAQAQRAATRPGG